MFTWIFEHIERSHLLHIGLLYLISSFGGILSVLLGASAEAAQWNAFYSGSAAAVTKEYADWAWGGKFDPKDLSWDYAGIALGMLTTFLITIG